MRPSPNLDLVPRPSRAPARKGLESEFLALLNQHDDVFYVDCGGIVFVEGTDPEEAGRDHVP